MSVTFNSTARRSAAIASARLDGGPHTPGPVMRIAPNPRRLTGRSPPRRNIPLSPASIADIIRWRLLSKADSIYTKKMDQIALIGAPGLLTVHHERSSLAGLMASHLLLIRMMC